VTIDAQTYHLYDVITEMSKGNVSVSGSHPTSCPRGTGDSYPGHKAAGT
jgi:hypothetical protein